MVVGYPRFHLLAPLSKIPELLVYWLIAVYLLKKLVRPYLTGLHSGGLLSQDSGIILLSGYTVLKNANK